MAWLRNKYGGWFEIPDEDVKSDYISKGTLYTNQNGARIKVLDADDKSVTYRITSDKDISLDTVSSKSEDKTVTKEGFQKMLSSNGYKSQSQKEKQIEANKKEADKKNAEEKQKDADKQKIESFGNKHVEKEIVTYNGVKMSRGDANKIRKIEGDLDYLAYRGANTKLTKTEQDKRDSLKAELKKFRNKYKW